VSDYAYHNNNPEKLDLAEEIMAGQACKMLHKNWALVDYMIKLYMKQTLTKAQAIRVMRRALDMMDGQI
jgi:hypothetical protein